MKTEAAVLYEMGATAPFARSRPLRIETIELAAPGPGEVLVEVAAAGLCHSDLSVIDGSRPRVMPMVMGHEAAGIVREVGPGTMGSPRVTTSSSRSCPGRLPVELLASGTLLLEAINKGFDRLATGTVVRQIVRL